MTIHEICSRFAGVTGGPTRFQAKCPAHDDRRASVSISEGDKGGVVVHCHAGCQIGAVLSVAGLKISDLAPPNGKGGASAATISDTYDYTDAAGKVLFQVVRYVPKDFRQRRKAPDGSWAWNLEGVERVLYHLPKLIAADPGDPVFICEGEKDVHAVEGLGLVATTNPGGAGKWRPEFSEILRGRWVVLLPDSDDAGRKHAEQVRASIAGIARKVGVLRLPGHGKDVSDWIGSGGTARELLQLATLAPEADTATPAVELLSESLLDWERNPPPPVRWLFEGLLPESELALLFGKPFGGKSLFALQKGLHAAAGLPFLNFQPTRPMRVLYVDEEMGRSLMHKRLEMMKAGRADFRDPEILKRFRVTSRKGLKVDSPALLETLHREIEMFPGGIPDFVIYDTLRRIHGAKEDSSDEMAEVMRTLAQISERYRCASLPIHHSKKSAIEEGDWRDAARGSGDLVAASQAVISVWKTADLLFSMRADAKAGGEIEPLPLLLDDQTLLYRRQTDDERFAAKEQQRAEAVKEAKARACRALRKLKESGDPDSYPASTNLLVSKVEGRRETTRQAIDALEEEGVFYRITGAGRGGGFRWCFTEDAGQCAGKAYEARLGRTSPGVEGRTS